MFSRIKNKLLSLDIASTLPIQTPPAYSNNFVPSPSQASSSSLTLSQRNIDNKHLPNKFTYNRPIFLQLLTHDELRASADHNVRPIIVPRDISIMPYNSGYAECVNSGKSEWNEDQAAFYQQILTHPTNKDEPGLPYTYFGVFDGNFF